MNKVAVLGTGKMGGAIVRRLKSGGFDVSVWDRTAVERTQAGSGPAQPALNDAQGSWLEHGLDPSSLEGAIARMVPPATR